MRPSWKSRRPALKLAATVVLVFACSVVSLPALGQVPTPESTPPGGDPDGGRAHPELRPGDVFQDFHVAAGVPRPGSWVFASMLHAEEGDQTVAIKTDLDGSVTVYNEGDDRQFESETEAPSIPSLSSLSRRSHLSSGNECSDTAPSLEGWSWSENFAWWFKANSVPSGMNVDNARQAVRDATSSITQARNLCDIADTISATHAYQGDTTTPVDMDTTDQCDANGDDKSVMSFGNLDGVYYAGTCVWGNDVFFPSGAVADESDMKINSFDHDWVSVPGPSCTTDNSVRSVTTHERGHTFGIAHVSSTSHPRLTMRGAFGTSLQCNDEFYWIGLGDYDNLEALY